MKNDYIKSNDINIFYKTIGEGTPCIVLAGGPGCSHEYLFEPLEALSKHVQLVFIDQRGTGKTDRANPKTYTLSHNVEDIENVRKALGYDKIILCGHSYGGSLALEYANKYQHNLLKLLLLNCEPSAKDINNHLLKMRLSTPKATQAIYDKYEQEGLYKNGNQLPPEYQEALDIAYEPIFIGIKAPGFLQKIFDDLSLEVYKTMWSSESEFKITGTIKDFNAYKYLSDIQTPTKLIIGANDMVEMDVAKNMISKMPNAQLSIYENSRHFPFMEEPERFLTEVTDFLEKE